MSAVPMVAAERRGAVMPAWVPERVAAKRTGDAPAEKLAAKDRPRFVVIRMTGAGLQAVWLQLEGG
ncbi:hypothetical protein ABIA26_001649 [Sinorhizobium fredii]